LGVTEGRYRCHGDLLVLIVFAALRAEEILSYCSRLNSAGICIDPDQKAELILWFVISPCGRKSPVILQCGIVADWVTKNGRAWPTRGTSKLDHKRIAENTFTSKSRDLTRYLNNWAEISDL
jgi:hypothetical protein